MMRVPIAWKIGLLVTGCVIVVAAIAGYVAYRKSIQVLVNHEIVDLKDDTLVRANWVAAQIATLREDTLALARTADVLRAAGAGDPGVAVGETTDPQLAATDRGWRTELESACKKACWYQHGNPKPYSQVRFIGADGREIIRVERKPLGKDDVEFVGVAFHDLDTKDTYNKSDRTYFTQAKELFREANDWRAQPENVLRVVLSDVELNVEDGVERPDEPVLRAWVPVFGAADEFLGIVIINMDFQQIRKGLAGSPRHLVYLTNERGDFLVHADKRLEFVWDDPAKNPAKHDRRQQAVAARLQQETYFRDVANFYDPAYEDKLVPTMDGSRRELEERGFSFPKFPNRLRPGQDAFTLAVVQLVDPSAKDDLGSAFQRLKNERPGFRAPPEKLMTLSINYPISAPNDAEMTQVVGELEREFGSKIGIKYVTRCETFAAHFFRIYIDPSDPDRYLGLVMAFSYEEMDAELAETKQAIFWSVALPTAGVALLALVFSQLVARRLRQITRAAKRFAVGEFDSVLPLESRDEIGDLARGFKHMVNEVVASQNRLLQLNADLDRRVKDRTQELEAANEGLKKAHDKAQELNSAKDAFLASVSHELRNPLNQVSGFCQLLELTDLDDEQRADLLKIRGAGNQLLMLINDILDYQKIVMGGITLEPEQITVSELLDEIRDAMELPARDNSSQLVVHCGPDVGTLYADKQRVRQVLLNLVGNACKFTENGTVSIGASRVADNGHESIVFDVSDTGRGMTPDEQVKLFTPFTKLSARQGNRTGTGLGLVISKGFCEMMHGGISLQSEYGHGSTFTVRLPADTTVVPAGKPASDAEAVSVRPKGGPRHVATGVARAVEAAAELAKGEPGPLGEAGIMQATGDESRTVLVIDDDAAVREVMTRYLEGRGFHVVTATGGLEGLEKAERLRPAAITLDAMMPGLDGWGVLAALKANRQTTDIPVIMVTITDEEERFYSLGAAEFLTKPVNWELLSEVLARYTGNKRDRSILVVEDETEAREILRRNLERDGWRVLEAEHGKAALELLGTEQPAAILLDLMMPVMDGFEFLAEYCQLAEWLSIPVIVVSAKDPTPEELSRLDGLVVRVLRKGQYTQDELLKEIHRRVDQHIRV